jgi:UPF0755 protein
MEGRILVATYQKRNKVMAGKNRKIIVRLLLVSLSIILLAAGAGGYLFWRAVYKSNTALPEGQLSYLFIKTGSNYDDLLNELSSNNFLQNINTFEWLAERKNLPNHIYPGRYELKAGLNNDELIDMLRSGAQKPLNVTFNNVRTLKQLAGVISRQIEADSLSLLTEFTNQENYTGIELNPQTYQVVFIPNTYEFYWNTPAKGFIERMKLEYERFWNESRRNKAKQQNLRIEQVSVVASIVDKETNRNDEKARIAGVYLNRLRDGWKLQADPTAVYAFYLENDSLLHRVYKKHTQIESPYNTYIHMGLPPGPICIPSISGIDAVLNAENHQYMYFVAKADGSGYHQFSKTYKQHLANAKQFHEELNKRKNKSVNQSDE